jgi:hypothetical protein
MSLVVESGNIPNCHETRKGGQGPTLGCSAIDDDEYNKQEARHQLLTTADIITIDFLFNA